MTRPIVLVALNARFSHSAFGLRWLIANLGLFRHRARLLELTIAERPVDVVERVLSLDPVLVGFGVYLWNVMSVLETVAVLKRLRPGLPIVLGGPEVSFPDDLPAGAELADWIVTGEGELALRRLCELVLAGRAPHERIIPATPPPLAELCLPYELYDDTDLAHRKLYVEASRGCPYACEFCLSSRDRQVRRFPAGPLLTALDRLWQRGARQFKFVDRAMHLAITPELLRFFLDRWEPGAFLHFELIPDQLPAELVPLLAEFPPGAVQLEAGVQSFSVEVAERVGVRHNLERLAATFRTLRETTGVHLHADLLVGLPGETLEGLAAGFDQLVALGPQEIQLGLLKRLRGAPLCRHEQQWQLEYAPRPPYEILQTSEIDFATMQRLRRCARYLDLVVNSGNFVSAASVLLDAPSPFARVLALADWLYETTGQTHGIALTRLARLLFIYLTEHCGWNAADVRQRLDDDFTRLGKAPIRLQREESQARRAERAPSLPQRQAKHRDLAPTSEPGEGPA